MNPQIKQKWVSALRSGDYQKTQCYLRTNNGFCCLGVLCDLYGKEDNVEWTPSGFDSAYAFQGNVGDLPSSVIEWAGLEDSNPYIIGGIGTLSGLNDKGFTFNKIADLIENHL